MRLAYAVVALACSSPAFATGGFECRPLSGTGPVLNMVVGHTLSARPIAVTLKEGKRTFSTSGPRAPLAIGQSWIDHRYLWLDLTDASLSRREAVLRAVFQLKLRSRPAIGTLIRNGRTYKVRCLEA